MDSQWQGQRRQEVINGIHAYYQQKIAQDPQAALQQIEEELISQATCQGNDWIGRGIVMETVLAASVEGLEMVRSLCLQKINQP